MTTRRGEKIVKILMRWAMTLCGVVVLIGALIGAGPARAQNTAQDVVWIQIEARPSLAAATDRARAYATLLQDVNGFRIRGGWYAVALGPYRLNDAELVLRKYQAEGLIPRDSFLQYTENLRQQFWPVGANLLGSGTVQPPAGVAQPTTPPSQPEQPLVSEVAPPPPPDETPAEARRSERELSREERQELQIALKWAGYYSSAIDGAFGRGTRKSMAAWQNANGIEPTGVLTTAQRAELLRQYNAVLEGMDLRRVSDTRAGVEMLIPRGVVGFDRYDPPFAHYEPTGDIAARVLLISQPGNQATLFGLYEIMQTLEIVPLEGERKRNSKSFTLEGRNNKIVSHTEARLEGGAIKGFTLIWPAGDEERRRRVLAEMQKSFTTFDAVLSPSAGQGGEQSIDLVAGLQVRKPRFSRSGFFISRDGTVVTTAEAVANCGRITLDAETEADLVMRAEGLGLAFLRPKTPLAPRGVAMFDTFEPRLQADLAAAGFSYEGVLGAPSLNFGKLEDVKGLDGNKSLSRLSMRVRDGDAGGPVLNQTGAVVGMLLPRGNGGPQIPEDVALSLDAVQVVKAASDIGLELDAQAPTEILSSAKMADQARDMTVLVSCWE